MDLSGFETRQIIYPAHSLHGGNSKYFYLFDCSVQTLITFVKFAYIQQTFPKKGSSSFFYVCLVF